MRIMMNSKPHRSRGACILKSFLAMHYNGGFYTACDAIRQVAADKSKLVSKPIG
jgi:hypothetical protein